MIGQKPFICKQTVQLNFIHNLEFIIKQEFQRYININNIYDIIFFIDNKNNFIFQNGRDMKYHYQSCDLMVVGNSSEVYRLNLEQGRFMKSLFTSLPAINVI